MASTQKRIECFRLWAGIKELNYPRRKYIKKCLNCNREHLESTQGYNCSNCGKKDSLIISLPKTSN